jgi:hypothetical protein
LTDDVLAPHPEQGVGVISDIDISEGNTNILLL